MLLIIQAWKKKADSLSSSTSLYLFWCCGAMVVGKLPPDSPWKSEKAWSPPAFGASWKSWKSSSSALVPYANIMLESEVSEVINSRKIRNWAYLWYLCWRETGNEICVCGLLSQCCRCHRHDWWRGCCGHGHGDRGLGHHGLLVLRHDRGHGHSQSRQVRHGRRRKLAEDFHVHCREATLKVRTRQTIFKRSRSPWAQLLCKSILKHDEIFVLQLQI